MEEVKAATDTRETARNNAQIARVIAGATDSVEDMLNRRFYPEVDVRYADWPSHVDPVDGSRVVSLDYDVVELTELTVAGVPVDESLYELESERDGEPPYVAVRLDASVTLPDGVATRDAVGLAGTFGFDANEDAAGTLATTVDDATDTVDVSDSSAVGVGSLLRIGAERMLVDRKSMLDTGQTTQGALTNSNADQLLLVTSGAAYAEGEVVMVDAEKMLVVEIAANTLVVKRAWDGSTLAAHNPGAAVFAPRRLTVRRGVLGTAASEHTAGAMIGRHRIPDLVRQLGVAESLVGMAQENGGYGRTVGSEGAERPAAGAGIEDLRARARAAYGRRRS
jgi:hypothetical protein